MNIRRQRREDPAYLTAMREAKELFDAEMAKNSMKGRGRPKTVVVAAPAAAAEIEIDHEVGDEIADLSPDEGEVDEVEAEEAVPAIAVKPAAKAPVKAKTPAKPAVKAAAKAPVKAVKKPAAKKKAAPAKKAARKR
jgi:hypothetical protein